MTKPLISVVMPVHNAQNYIGKAIESILSQTFKNFELIIVNDCSTDKTLQIIESYAKKDSRIKIINNNKRLDIAGSLNKGTENASSNIIARMDSDDISLPNRLELQYKLIRESNRISAVGANITIINSKGSVIGARKYPEDSMSLKSCLFRYSPFAHPVVMFRKDKFEAVGGYDPRYSPTEDLDLWFRLGKEGEFKSIPKSLILYRVYPKSSSHRSVKSVELLVFRIRLKAIIKYGYWPSLYDLIYNFFQFVTLWFTPAIIRIKLYNLLRNNNLI